MTEKVAVPTILKSIRSRLKLVLGIAFLSVAAVWILMVFIMADNFQATSQILVADTEATSPRPDPQNIEIYNAMIKSREVLQKVISATETSLSVGELHDKITVSHTPGSQVIHITAEDRSSKTAGEIANALAYVSKEEALGLMDADNISVISTAPEKEMPSPLLETLVFNLGIAGGFGLIVGSLLAFILEMLNTVFHAGIQERQRKEKRLQTVFK